MPRLRQLVWSFELGDKCRNKVCSRLGPLSQRRERLECRMEVVGNCIHSSLLVKILLVGLVFGSCDTRPRACLLTAKRLVLEVALS